MNTIETGVKCSVCKTGNIVAETCWKSSNMDGPGGFIWPTVECFHCNNEDCQVVFHHPPGKPNMKDEILTRMREEEGDDL